MARRYPNYPIPPAAAQKYATRYTEDESGCWVSDYAANKATGYAAASWRVDGKAYSSTAHRAAWTHHNGPIPDGMTIDHICRTKTCIRPDHLRLLSLADNSARKVDDWPLDRCRWGHGLEFMKRHDWPSGAQTQCTKCQDERNEINTQITTNLRRLEITYGLGEWHKKKTITQYRKTVNERNGRLRARREARLAGDASSRTGERGDS